MLSKSQAKSFFIIGTFVCSGAFVGLTIDSIQRIPIQTHAENLKADVIRGKHLFEKNNCMGCHTIMGEGAYYAPELTKVMERRDESFVRSMIKNPDTMFPGQRKMTNYHLSDTEISDLIAFLKWIGKMDLNGFPPKPDLVSAVTTGNTKIPHLHPPAVFNKTCTACHSVQGNGGSVGPALDGVGDRRDSEYLKKWLQDPTQIKADSKMPKLPLSEQEIDELVQFLSQLRGV